MAVATPLRFWLRKQKKCKTKNEKKATLLLEGREGKKMEL